MTKYNKLLIFIKSTIFNLIGSPYIIRLLNLKNKKGEIFTNKYDSFYQAKEKEDKNYWNSIYWQNKRIKNLNRIIKENNKNNFITLNDTDFSCYGLISFLISLLNNEDKIIEILDYGGSNGIDYFRTKNSIKNINYNWSVYDKIKLTKNELELIDQKNNKNLFFIDKLNHNNKFDIILSSSVFQYVNEYEKLLKEFFLFKPKYIFFMRFWCLDSEKDLYTTEVQNNQAIIIISYKKFNSILQKNGYKLLFKGPCSVKNNIALANININNNLFGDSNLIYKRII